MKKERRMSPDHPKNVCFPFAFFFCLPFCLFLFSKLGEKGMRKPL